jgi:thiol-disulfide isomerase/thioredoxin
MSVVAEEKIHEFKSGSYAQILESRHDKPFILVLWSLDCPSCYKELKMLGQFKKRHSSLDVVLVATDLEAMTAEFINLLSEYQLEEAESWAFNGDSEDVLRYDIDPSWHGELPRSYLFSSSHKKQIISGLLSVEKLASWLQSVVSN